MIPEHINTVDDFLNLIEEKTTSESIILDDLLNCPAEVKIHNSAEGLLFEYIIEKHNIIVINKNYDTAKAIAKDKSFIYVSSKIHGRTLEEELVSFLKKISIKFSFDTYDDFRQEVNYFLPCQEIIREAFGNNAQEINKLINNS